VVRCLLAIELSKASWIVAVHTPLSDKISRYTLEGCDWKSLLELIERIRKRVTREFGPSVEMISCYEASYDGFWLHRLLEGHGVRNHVIDPTSLWRLGVLTPGGWAESLVPQVMVPELAAFGADHD
jgi:transposase